VHSGIQPHVRTTLKFSCTLHAYSAQREELTAVARSLPHNHRVHFTPDFSWDSSAKASFPYYNKAYGVQHFLRNALPPIAETVIALLEPDMVLMQPVSPFLDVNSTLFHTGNAAPELIAEHERPCVSEGHSVAQVSSALN
jgi:hypothetical protein